MGWRARERLPTIFFDALKTMKPGRGERVLRSPTGFHIAQAERAARRRRARPARRCSRRACATSCSRPTSSCPRTKRATACSTLKERLENNGADFAELARVHSEDTQRLARRRPRLGLPGRHRARVRARHGRAQARRDQRAGALAVRLAPDPGARARHARTCRRSGRGCRRARRCASASRTRPTRSGCASCATAPTSSCGSTNGERISSAARHRGHRRRARGHRPGPLRAAGAARRASSHRDGRAVRPQWRSATARLLATAVPRRSTHVPLARPARTPASSIRPTAATCCARSTARSTAACGRVRRHGHRAGAEERDQRRRHRLHRPHRIPRRAHAARRTS